MRWARPEIKTAKAMANKVLLMILDGWGKGDHGHDDVVFSAHPEYIDSLEATYPSAQLRTDGENVGLPEGWAIPKWVTSISVPGASSIRTS